MTERLSDKNPCDSCKVDRQIGNPNRWECECSRCDKPNDWKNDCIKKLAEYETAEEDGRLVVLPCKVGDTVYEIHNRYTYCTPYKERFDEASCYGCEEECDSHKEYEIIETKMCTLEIIAYNIRLGNFGKTVFLTREEAEKALEDMKK